MSLQRSLAALLLGAGLALPAVSDDLFTVTTVGNGTNTVVVSGSDVVELTESAIETSDGFASLGGQSLAITIDYLGVVGAANLSVNAAGTSATLTLNPTGFTRTFTGTDADDLSEQIEEFMLEDGSSAYAAFQEAINRQSLVGVLDGNPSGTTARLARHTFDSLAIGVTGPLWANPNRVMYEFEDSPGMVGWFQVSPTFEHQSSGPFDGNTAAVDLAGGLWFNEVIGISGGGNFSYTNLEDTDIFHSVGHFALNWAVIPLRDWDENPDDPWSNSIGWQVSPFVATGVGASVDAAAGGAFVGVGVASDFQLGYHDKVVLNWGSQYVHFEGLDTVYGDYEFETDLDQQIVSTGLIATVFLDKPDGSVFLDGGATYHAFLDDAAIDYWFSPEIGVGWRLSEDSRMRASYTHTMGNADYDGYALGFTFLIAF